MSLTRSAVSRRVATFRSSTATITYEGRGYAAAMGWIQFVRSSDGASGGAEFEMDPYEPLGRLSHPFCWFGFAPTLFDAPSRPSRQPMDWIAHSFLAFIATAGEMRDVRAILGFSWGFSIDGGDIALKLPVQLESSEWDSHISLLRAESRLALCSWLSRPLVPVSRPFRGPATSNSLGRSSPSGCGS
jgi:hypothetical protein